MNEPQIVVFDLDGTLVDTSQDLAAAVNGALAVMAPGTPPLPLAQVRAFVGSGARHLVERSLAAADVRRPLDEALPVFLRLYESCMLERTLVYPGVREALDRLADRRLAVLTNKPGHMSRAILDGLGLASRFAGIYGAGDVPARKPDPAGLRQVLAEAGVAPQLCVMVGDSGIDVLTGRSAGAATVGVSYGYDPGSFAEHPPDLLLDDLRELPGRLPLRRPA